MNANLRSTLATLLACLGIVAVLAAGCARGDPETAQPAAQPAAAANAQSLNITFGTVGAPAKGDNKIEAVVKRADGTPVTDASVAVTFRMPAMPTMNMPEMRSTAPLVHQGDGRYTGTGQLEMAGTWYVTVTVSRDGAQIGSSRSSVLAK